MKKRTIVYIVLGAIVLHIGLFLIFGQMRALPKTRYVPPPNFGYREEYYVDPRTGERTTWREIRVSTKLSGPEKIEAPSDKPTLQWTQTPKS